MCATCGCNEPDEPFTLLMPGEAPHTHHDHNTITTMNMDITILTNTVITTITIMTMGIPIRIHTIMVSG